MDVFQQGRKLMFIMQLTTPLKSSMPSKFIRLPSLSLKIEIDMSKDSSGLEEVIAQAIPEKWFQCGLKNS